MPCRLTQRFTRMPMAAILSSQPSPLSGRRTQTPMRSSRRSPVHVEGGQRADDPFLQRRHIAPHVRPAAVEVEHQVGHPLAGPVIGELPAAAGRHAPESGPRSVPPAWRWCRRCRAADVRAARPARARRRPRSRPRAPPWRQARPRRATRPSLTPPFDRRRARRRFQPEHQIVARVNHPLTIPW